MGDRGRFKNRIFQLNSTEVANDDDSLAPVVLAIDAVQQLLDEENRRKTFKHKNKKEESRDDVSNPGDLDHRDVKYEAKPIEFNQLNDQIPSSSTSISQVTLPKTQKVRQERGIASTSKAPKVSTPKNESRIADNSTVSDSANDFESDTLTIIKNNRLVEINDTRFQKRQDDYEFVPKSVILDVYSNDPEVKRFLKQLPKICNEFGFNEQDYKCYSCRRPIGMVFGQSRLCHFDGHHYCTECHLGEKSVAPARILCNWDFNKYPISKRNLHFLTLISNEPMFELKVVAPLLYKTCPELMEIEELRCQAFYVRSYCFTCAQDSISLDLTKLVWPREHLIKQTDTYSLEDLIQIKSGALKQVLKNVTSFGRQHILSCVLCCQKGFICELCKSSQIIYPFDTESVYRCNDCQSIYHKVCFKTKSGSDACPRCQRLKAKRNDN